MSLQKSRGVSLIELIFVIVTVSILAVWATTKMPSRSRYAVVVARDRAMRDIRFIQNASVSQYKTYGIVFDLTNNKYSVYLGDHNFSNIIDEPSIPRSYIIDYAEEYKAEVEIVSTDLAGHILQFDLYGEPSDISGNITSQKTIVVRDIITNKTIKVMIEPSTGALSHEFLVL